MRYIEGGLAKGRTQVEFGRGENEKGKRAWASVSVFFSFTWTP